jgi:hypothetical protein
VKLVNRCCERWTVKLRDEWETKTHDSMLPSRLSPVCQRSQVEEWGGTRVEGLLVPLILQTDKLE